MAAEFLPPITSTSVVVVRVGVAVVVRDLGQIFAGNAELVKEIVIASGDDYFCSFVVVRTTHSVGGRDA